MEGSRRFRIELDLEAWALSFAPGDALVVDGSPRFPDGGFLVVHRADEEGVPYARGEFVIPRRFYFLWAGEREPLPGSYTLRFQIEGRELVCKSVAVHARTGAVTGGKLRRVPLPRLIEMAGARAAYRLVRKRGGGLEHRRAIETVEGKESWLSAYQEAADSPRPRRGKRVPDETLQRVAEVYRAALLSGHPPVRSVQEAFAYRVARSTVGRWVMEARHRGYLGEAPAPGRAGEKKGKDNG